METSARISKVTEVVGTWGLGGLGETLHSEAGLGTPHMLLHPANAHPLLSPKVLHHLQTHITQHFTLRAFLSFPTRSSFTENSVYFFLLSHSDHRHC